MTPRDLIDDLRSRINPAYAAQIGTESYERRLCAEALEAQADEIERLRGLLGEPLRVIAVEAIREATGCPDIKGYDGEYLTEKLLAKAAELLAPNAYVTGLAPGKDDK